MCNDCSITVRGNSYIAVLSCEHFIMISNCQTTCEHADKDKYPPFRKMSCIIKHGKPVSLEMFGGESH